jgi:Domain of unknown function (DUF222)/HNH endonuclease
MEGMDFTRCTVDELERFVTGVETAIGAARTAQAAALRELDRRQVPLGDGCRSLAEWVSGRLDVSPDTAKTLVGTAHRLTDLPLVEKTATAGDLSYDRIAAVARLASHGGDEATVVADAARWDIAGLHRQVASRRRLSRQQERAEFRDQYCATQANLDHTGLDFHGRLVGVAGRVFEEALHTVGDQLPKTPGVVTTRSQRNAHALWRIATDALAGDPDGAGGDGSGYQVTVFVDATTGAVSNGETGVMVESGPRVGSQTLEAVICAGVTEVTAVTEHGTPLNMGRRSRVVSPQLRRYTLHRDGGACTADGCVSRYRLQAHHITPWSQGGTTDAYNLTTLCWYHHHVIVHGLGYTIDPTTPPHRRRFNPPRDHDPP